MQLPFTIENVYLTFSPQLPANSYWFIKGTTIQMHIFLSL